MFSNNYLTKRALRRLREEGFRPYWHQRESPNVGGIALAQIAAEYATDDLSETRTVRRDERPDQHARTVRQKPQLMPPNLNRSHVTMGV